MADLEAVLADVSYLMAMEKSKASNAHRTSRKMTLPDPSVRSVMKRHLQDRDELKFDALTKQRLAYLLFKDFCQKNHDRRFELYHKINKLDQLFSTDDKFEHQKALIDSYFASAAMIDQLLSKPIVYQETVTTPTRRRSDAGHLNRAQTMSLAQTSEASNSSTTRLIGADSPSKQWVAGDEGAGAESSSSSPGTGQNVVHEYCLPEKVIGEIKHRAQSLQSQRYLYQQHSHITSSSSKSSVGSPLSGAGSQSGSSSSHKRSNSNEYHPSPIRTIPGSPVGVGQTHVAAPGRPKSTDNNNSSSLLTSSSPSGNASRSTTTQHDGSQSASIAHANNNHELQKQSSQVSSAPASILAHIEKFPFHQVQEYLGLYLKHSVYPQFLKSDQFTRFCQWKNVELSIQLGMNDFSVHRIIGRGGFGEVYGCRKADTGKMYAMKCLDKKRIKLKQGETLALNERFILQLVSSGSKPCNFIVGMTYAFTTQYKVCFLLDLMNGGDLHYHLTQHIFTEEEVRFYVAEVALGLEHMHSRGVVYRDLKPANILLAENGHVRISDLGLACDFLHKRPHASVGTHGYMAPEVLQRGVSYDSSADWFSLGCMIYKLLRGHSPFRPHRNKDKYEIDRLTLSKDVEMPTSFSTELQDLLSKLLIKDPRDRLCCTGDDPTQGCSELKNHAFFRDVNWDVMKSLGYPAPMIPPRGEVNAHDAFDIGNFDDDETKGIKLSDQDQTIWDHFHVVVSDRWQREIGETVFDQVNSEQDKIELKRKGKCKIGEDAQGISGTIESIGNRFKKMLGMKESDDYWMPSKSMSLPYASGKDCIMHGYVYKLGGPFGTQWHRKYFYLFPNRIESVGDENSLLAIDQISAIDPVHYRGYKCLQIKLKQSAKLNLFLRFDTEPDFVQWRKELTRCFQDVHRLTKRGPKQMQSTWSIQCENQRNRAVAIAKGDIPTLTNTTSWTNSLTATGDRDVELSSASTGHIYMGPTSNSSAGGQAGNSRLQPGDTKQMATTSAHHLSMSTPAPLEGLTFGPTSGTGGPGGTKSTSLN